MGTILSALRLLETDESDKLRARVVDLEVKREVLQAERADVGWRTDRDFSAFEAGTFTAELCRDRVALLRARLTRIDDELGLLATEAESAPASQLDAEKGPLALLIEEIRIVSPADIRPVYRIPGEVRIPADTEPTGRVELPIGGNSASPSLPPRLSFVGRSVRRRSATSTAPVGATGCTDCCASEPDRGGSQARRAAIARSSRACAAARDVRWLSSHRARLRR